jgi:hypothetical protein
MARSLSGWSPRLCSSSGWRWHGVSSSPTDAAAEAGTYRVTGARRLRAEGGLPPCRGRDLKGRCLTFSEREEIAVALAGGQSSAAISHG